MESDISNILNIARDLKTRTDEETDYIIHTMATGFKFAIAYIAIYVFIISQVSGG